MRDASSRPRVGPVRCIGSPRQPLLSLAGQLAAYVPVIRVDILLVGTCTFCVLAVDFLRIRAPAVYLVAISAVTRSARRPRLGRLTAETRNH